jgi:N-acetylmuramoyl-L-alanine amidase CwlA
MSRIVERIRCVAANSGNVGGPREADEIRYLVYHYTGNDGDTAVNNARYYRDNVVRASAHYFVDDNEVVQSVADLRTAWAVGGRLWTDCISTGGGTLYGVVTNRNSLSVEMCGTRKDGTRRASEKTLQNAAELGRLLMDRYRIPPERVVRHFDVTGKHCPAYLMNDAKWRAFRARLTDGEENMKRYNTMKEISDGAPWAVETVEKLIGKNILRGGGLRDTQGRPADMDLSADMLRLLVWNDRAGLYE